MTPTDLDALDRMAAEKIMGWIFAKSPYGTWDDFYSFGGYKVVAKDWQPTRRIEQAFEMLEKFYDYSPLIAKSRKTGLEIVDIVPSWICILSLKGMDIEMAAETASLAITLACLKAVGVNIDG